MISEETPLSKVATADNYGARVAARFARTMINSHRLRARFRAGLPGYGAIAERAEARAAVRQLAIIIRMLENTEPARVRNHPSRRARA